MPKRRPYYIAEALTGAAILAGWAFVTAGVAAVTSRVAWLFSLGLLCLSAAGWRMVWTIARSGLYTLTRDKDGQ